MRNGIIFGFIAAFASSTQGVSAQTLGPETGLPLPRFESLRFDKANMRRGPGATYPKSWVFRRKGLPMQVFREYEDWRQVRDPYGDIGWIKRTQLSRVRYGLVVEDRAPLRSGTEDDARPVALAAQGVVLLLDECSVNWCHGRAKGYSGWIRKRALFGVGAEEKFKGD